MDCKLFLAIQKPLDYYLTTLYFNHFHPKTSLLVDVTADVILEDLALALKVLRLDKFAKRLSISDFPCQWHLSDRKVILLIILYQHGFKNVYIPNFGTIADGPKVCNVGTKITFLDIHKMEKWPFVSQCTKFGSIGNGSKNLTS